MAWSPPILNCLWGVTFPLSFLWALAAKLRRRFPPPSYASAVSTICVGNIHAGGSGKTPLTRAIAQHFSDRSPAILSRGYRGRAGAHGERVKLSHESGAAYYGDEPWMLALSLNAPVYVDRNRVRAIKKMEEQNPPSLVILDDGFQHLKLRKTLSLVLISTRKDPGEAYCLPWGELREPLEAMRAATAVVFVRDPEESTEFLNRWKRVANELAPDVPHFVVSRHYGEITSGKPHLRAPVSLVGFCGLADPSGFRASLESKDLKAFRAFPDHFTYSQKDLKMLDQMRRQTEAEALVTTEKDWYKVQGLAELDCPIYYLPMDYVIPSEFWDFLENGISDR